MLLNCNRVLRSHQCYVNKLVAVFTHMHLLANNIIIVKRVEKRYFTEEQRRIKGLASGAMAPGPPLVEI